MKVIYDFFVGISNGFGEIWTHKLRSLLSMSGIILGCAAVIAMMSVVEHIVGLSRQTFEDAGGVTLIEVTRQEVPAEQADIASLSKGLTIDDAYALRYAVPLLEYISPQVWVAHSRLVTKRGTAWFPVYGIFGDNVIIGKREIDKGRNLSEMDMQKYASVAVVGADYAERAFGPGVDPLGKYIQIRGALYQIVGVTKKYERIVGNKNVLAEKNRIIYIPVTTAVMRYRGDRGVNNIYMQVHSAEFLSDAVAQINNTLTQMHNGIEDFTVKTREGELENYKKTERNMKLALGGVALISLLIGGIAIMNVMLAVINERIREIGVRKALGARSADIFIQFLAESIVISFVGGIFGMLLSIGLVMVLRILLDAPSMEVPLNAMLNALCFSMSIGLLSGIYPSLRAARLDPITALRYD